MKIRHVVVAVGLAAVCGCTPEETFVAVNASALKKAVAGELASAKVEMVFNLGNKKDPELPNKIRKAALPHLGEGAVVELEKTEKRKVKAGGSIRDDDDEVEVGKTLDDAKLVARFNIPVGTPKALASAPRSILWLRYDAGDRMFRLVHGNAVRALNSSLSRVDGSIEFEYDGGEGSGFGEGTTIKIIKDDSVTIGVAAVDVNGKKVISGSVDVGRGSAKICYNNGFYNGVAPCFVYGGFPSIVPEPLKEKGSRDDGDDD